MKDTELIQEIEHTCEEMGRQVIFKSHSLARYFKLNSHDFESLQLLIQNGPMTAGKIATATGLTTGAVTGLLDRLESAGYVQRQPDKLDRRRTIIIATKQTVKKFQQLHKRFDKEFGRSLSNYSPAELITVRNFLQTTAEAYRQETLQLTRHK